MTMYDWAIIGITAGFLVLGRRKGLVREVIDVALLLVGTLVVFRVSPVLGTIASGMAAIPYEVGRVVAGAVVFVVLVVGSIVLGRVIATALKVVPGAGALDALGGAVVGAGFAAIVIVLGTTVLSAAPMPDASRRAFDDQVAESRIGHHIVDSGGPLQPIVASMSGDHLFRTVIAVREAIGERFMAGTIPVPLPSVDGSKLLPSQTLAQAVFDQVNRERIARGADPLAWSPDLAVVSVARASTVYRSGVLALDRELGEALAAAGVPGTMHTDLVVMAASSEGLVEAITAAPAYASAIADRTYRKSAVGVVDGPYGLIAVQVLSG